MHTLKNKKISKMNILFPVCVSCDNFIAIEEYYHCKRCSNINLIFCHDCFLKTLSEYNTLWICPSCKDIYCDICIGDEHPCVCNCNSPECYNVDDTELVCEQCFKTGMKICNYLECDKFCKYCLQSCIKKENIDTEEYLLCDTCVSNIIHIVTNIQE
jgi:hypothetical protein